MKNVYFWTIYSLFLYGETYDTATGTFEACITSSFCVSVANKTLTHEFTSAEITTNASSAVTMGTFTLTFDDTTTMGGATHTTTISSRYTSGTTMQLQRILATGVPDLATQADLVVTDSRDINGSTTGAPFTIVNNEIIRQRDDGDGTITAEVHSIIIKVATGELDAAKTGRYQNMIFLTLASI